MGWGIDLCRRPSKTSSGALVDDSRIPRIYAWGVCQKETETNAKMFDLIQDNNFVNDEFGIDDISKPKFEVTQIQTKETDELKQPEISFTDEK
jgi:hypothetical protein